jgi:hypothetical protein
MKNSLEPRTSARNSSRRFQLKGIAWLVLAGTTWWLSAAATSAATYYVATNGKDSWSGTLPAPNANHTDGPFASLARAQQAVRTLARSLAVTVEIRQGTYYLPLSPTNPGTLSFSAADSGTASLPITWQNYPGEVPTVDGGVLVGSGGLGLTWTLVASFGGTAGPSDLWSVQLPPLPSQQSTTLGSLQPFEYLYYQAGQAASGGASRRLRARIESPYGVGYAMSGGQCTAVPPPDQGAAVVPVSLCNLGTFLRINDTIPYSTALIQPTCSQANSVTDDMDKTKSKCLDRFKYNSLDPIKSWINLNGTYTGNPSSPCRIDPSNPYPAGDVELTLTDAWTVDAMRIACVDTANSIIYLQGATKGNPGVYNYFGPGVGKRYMVENVYDAFKAAWIAGQTGLWFLDRATEQLFYIANPGENPNTDSVIIPQLGGTIPGCPPQQDCKLTQDFVGGSLLWATDLSWVTFRGITFEVDDFIPAATGFNNDVNGEMSLPQAIDCEGCQNVTFDGITVQHTSASGILIASSQTAPASNDVIESSTFADLGDSGVRIGHTPTGSDTAAGVPGGITVQNNLIEGFSRVFADGEGIAQGNGHTMNYVHNDILDGYHAGISACQEGCPGQAGANGVGIVSSFNHIRNIIQGITSDGGTLYYNVRACPPNSPGCNVISYNVVHDTSDSSIIDQGVKGSAYGGRGIYLDAQTPGVAVENNVVYRVSEFTLFMNQGPAAGDPPNTFTNNILSLGYKGMFFEQSHDCSSNPTARLYSNVFNFDRNESDGFQVQGGSTDSCDLAYNQYQDFQGNAYWRAGTPATGPLFCNDLKAFNVLNVPLSFDTPPMGNKTWQYGIPPAAPVVMDEDVNPMGTCSWNPTFGTSGAPSDYLLSSGPPTPFDYRPTNNAINAAGRTSGAHSLPTPVPATFPTYVYTIF